jgi:hypothetical protein
MEKMRRYELNKIGIQNQIQAQRIQIDAISHLAEIDG